MTTKPRVSVLLPAYNAEKYLAHALSSILNQTFTAFEIIAIDDCSSDSTWQILQEFARTDSRVCAFRNTTNLKMSGTLNRALQEAKGEYIARMDADDWSYPDRFRLQVAFLDNHPSVGICGGAMDVCDQDMKLVSTRKYHLQDGDIRAHLFHYSPFSHPLIMMRKRVLDQVGGYRDEFNPAEDYELYFRIGRVAQFANLPDVLLKYRVVPKSMTTSGTRNMELQTIRIRQLYAQEYAMSVLDMVYTWIHWLSVYLVPSSWKIWIFNSFRNRLHS